MSQIAEAYVRVRPDTTGFKQDVTRTVSRDLRGVERQLQSTNREFTRFGRGALVGTGALRELGRAAAFASLSFIGGAGVVVGIRSTIKAAMEAQVALGQVQNVVENAGVSWKQYGAQIEAAALAQSQLSGIDDERFLRTFSTLLRATGDVNRALEDNALAANVARGANIELEQAAKIVARAEAGQARGLAQLGVIVDKHAGRVEILTALQAKFAGSTAKFADTAAGAQARFNVAINETQEAIGTALLPTVTEYLNKATEWLNNEENQERIQRGVTRGVEATEKSVGLLTKTLGAFVAVGEGAVKVLRDLEEAAGPLGFPSQEELNRNRFDMQGLIAGREWHHLLPEFRDPNALGRIAADPGRADKVIADIVAAAVGSRGTNRNEQTGIDLARAQASGQRNAITSAIEARLAFVQDTIDFANRLLKEGRGDTKKLASTLQQFYGEQENLNSVLDGFAEADRQAREDRIEDAKRRAEEWRDANHQIQLAFEAARKQGREFHKRFSESIRQQAEDQRARLATRDLIRLQIIENRVAATNLLPETDRALQTRRDAQKLLVRFWREQAKNDRLSALEQLQAQGAAIAAQNDLRNIGRKDKESGGRGFTLSELFAEAGEEFAMYGSNVGPRGAPLSAQDARGALAQTIKTHNVNVTQFITAPMPISQAMIDARNAARVLQ